MTYLLLFLEFLKIGAFTFGGGYAMIPFILETVEKNGWMTTQELVDFIAVSESTPGAFAVNISTYVGSEVAGFFGAVVSTLGLILPAFVLILIIARFYNKYKESVIVSGCLMGLKSTVVGLILATLVSISIEVFFTNGFSVAVFSTKEFYLSLFVFLLCTFLLLYKKLSPIIIIGLSAGLGIIFGYTGLITV